MNSQKFMYPSIKAQLELILSRSDIQKVLWDHLDREEKPGFLCDIYDGSEWKRWKQTPVNPNKQDGPTWFSRRSVFEIAFAFNM